MVDSHNEGPWPPNTPPRPPDPQPQPEPGDDKKKKRKKGGQPAQS